MADLVREGWGTPPRCMQGEAQQISVIGLHGPARSGKDTICKLIQECHPEAENVIRDAFADRLKLSAARLFGIPEEQFYGWAEAMKANGKIHLTCETQDEHFEYRYTLDMDGRKFLQNYGTEAHRDVFGQDFWIDAVLPLEGRKDLGPEDLLVITDVRFENEAQAIVDVGGEVWRIERPMTRPTDGHVSEKPVSGHLIATTIQNDGTLQDLAEKVEAALS